jgi:hypothetical protein
VYLKDKHTSSLATLNLRPALFALLLLALHLRSKSVSALTENAAWISHDNGSLLPECAVLLSQVGTGFHVVLADWHHVANGGGRTGDREESREGDGGGDELHRDGRSVVGKVQYVMGHREDELKCELWLQRR